VGGIAAALAALAVFAWWSSPGYGCVAIRGGDSTAVLLNVNSLGRGTVKKYCWGTPDGARTVRFIVARRSDNAIAVVLDACRVCYLNRLGYRISRSGIMCRYCGNHYSIDSLSAERCPACRSQCPSSWNADGCGLELRTSRRGRGCSGRAAHFARMAGEPGERESSDARRIAAGRKATPRVFISKGRLLAKGDTHEIISRYITAELTPENASACLRAHTGRRKDSIPMMTAVDLRDDDEVQPQRSGWAHPFRYR
jgi:predicted Zn-ribbon and HTH transcriptional regulator